MVNAHSNLGRVLTPYFLLYKGEQEAQRRTAPRPVSRRIRPGVTRPQRCPQGRPDGPAARGRCACARPLRRSRLRPSPHPRTQPGARRPAAAGGSAARGAEPGPCGWSREPRRRRPGPAPCATMAFGKSHRDPYATSVGQLIGKRGTPPARGRDATR